MRKLGEEPPGKPGGTRKGGGRSGKQRDLERQLDVDGPGSGAASTVLLARRLFDDDNPVAIINSDQFIDWNSNEFFYAMAADSCDGGIVTFKSTHPKWSFVRLDQDGFAAEIAEKTPISQVATAGVYYFRKGGDLVRNLEAMMAANRHFKDEFYVSPVYNEYIRDNRRIRVFPVTNAWSLKTPKDVDYFVQDFCRNDHNGGLAQC